MIVGKVIKVIKRSQNMCELISSWKSEFCSNVFFDHCYLFITLINYSEKSWHFFDFKALFNKNTN